MTRDDDTKEKLVETYAEDMANVIENDRSGLIRKIIHEEEQHEIVKKNLSPTSKRNRIFMFVSFLLILFGFFIFLYFLSTREPSTVPVEKQFVPLIFTDKSVYLEIKDLNKKEEIAQVVLNKVNTTEVKKGGLEGIYLVKNKKIVGLREFLTLTESNFFPNEDPFFVKDNFLMGVVNGETKPVSTDASQGGDFFLLIKVRAIADVFDSLRAWENKMFSDLRGFFGISLSAETKHLLIKDFEDGIVQNKNARILYDDEKNIIMVYVLADDNSVIIANTESTVREIMLRLASSRIEK